MTSDVEECLNCQAKLEGSTKFCAVCGQKIQPLKTTLGELLGDFWEATFGIDSKFFKTLWLLFAKPGFLTRQYFEGKRVTYLRPVTLFLLIASVFFISLQWFGSRDPIKKINYKGGDYTSVSIVPGFNVTFTSDQVEATQTANDEELLAMVRDMNVNLSPLQEQLVFKSLRVIRKDGLAELRQRLYSSGSHAVALLIPLMAFVVKLLHWRRGVYFLDAVIYCLHLHCAFFCAFMLLNCFPQDLIRDRLAMVLGPAVLWYTVRSLVVAFDNSYLLASLKALVVLCLQAIVTVLLTTAMIVFNVMTS